MLVVRFISRMIPGCEVHWGGGGVFVWFDYFFLLLSSSLFSLWLKRHETPCCTVVVTKLVSKSDTPDTQRTIKH